MLLAVHVFQNFYFMNNQSNNFASICVNYRNNLQVKAMIMDIFRGLCAAECMTYYRNLCPQNSKSIILFCPTQTWSHRIRGHNPHISVPTGQRAMKKWRLSMDSMEEQIRGNLCTTEKTQNNELLICLLFDPHLKIVHSV